MIRNYLTVALRHLLKNKTFSAINILGLSTGIACCLLLSLYIEDEFSYEKHFDGHERVFRMYTTFTRDGIAESFPRTSPPIAMDLINDFGEVETATRVVNPPEVDVHLIRYGENVYHEKKGVLVDSSFLKVFPYSLKEGDPGRKPHITRSLINLHSVKIRPLSICWIMHSIVRPATFQEFFYCREKKFRLLYHWISMSHVFYK